MAFPATPYRFGGPSRPQDVRSARRYNAAMGRRYQPTGGLAPIQSMSVSQPATPMARPSHRLPMSMGLPIIGSMARRTPGMVHPTAGAMGVGAPQVTGPGAMSEAGLRNMTPAGAYLMQLASDREREGRKDVQEEAALDQLGGALGEGSLQGAAPDIAGTLGQAGLDDRYWKARMGESEDMLGGRASAAKQNLLEQATRGGWLNTLKYQRELKKLGEGETRELMGARRGLDVERANMLREDRLNQAKMQLSQYQTEAGIGAHAATAGAGILAGRQFPHTDIMGGYDWLSGQYALKGPGATTTSPVRTERVTSGAGGGGQGGGGVDVDPFQTVGGIVGTPSGATPEGGQGTTARERGRHEIGRILRGKGYTDWDSMSEREKQGAYNLLPERLRKYLPEGYGRHYTPPYITEKEWDEISTPL